MGIVGVLLLVVFVIICVLLVCIVLIQSEEGAGMGGLFGGSGSQAFGSRSGNVITRTTYILVTLFFVATFALAFINKAPSVKRLDAGETQVQGTPWLDSPEGQGEDAAAPEAEGAVPEAE